MFTGLQGARVDLAGDLTAARRQLISALRHANIVFVRHRVDSIHNIIKEIDVLLDTLVPNSRPED